MGDERPSIVNPLSGEQIRILRTAADTGGALLIWELLLAPGGRVPASHRHPFQEERFHDPVGSAAVSALFASYIEWGSRLAVQNSQAGSRPPEHMPMPRWDWRTAAGPPGSRPRSQPDGALTVADAPVVLPADGESVSLATHMKSLFRDRDRRSMLFAFDLWNHDDVTRHGEAILARLCNGTMPCDGAWPEPHVAAFARWIDEGSPA